MKNTSAVIIPIDPHSLNKLSLLERKREKRPSLLIHSQLVDLTMKRGMKDYVNYTYYHCFVSFIYIEDYNSNITKINSKLINNLMHEMDEAVNSEYELMMLTERMLNKLDSDDNKNIIHQIVNENGKLSPEKDFITSWELNCIKTEMNGELDNENDSKEIVFLDLEGENKFNGIKIEDITFDSCSENNLMRNNEAGYIINKIEGMNSSLKAEENNGNYEVSPVIATNHSEQKSYKCHSCDYSSSWKEYLQSHIKSVHLKKPRSHKCHLCDYSSSWKGDLQSHINSVHLKIKNHKCCKCDYSSSQKTAVRKHINSVHLKLRDHKCHLCDYTSSRNGDLQKHIKSVHLKLKNHKCHVCDYRSSRNGDLQSHIKSIHLKQKPYN